MSDKEKIKDWVKNLKSQASTIPNLGINALAGFQLACDDVIAFINSIPKEPASEDLEEEIKNYFSDWLIDLNNHKGFLIQFAHHFAEWGRNHFEDKSEMVSDDLEEVADKYAENHGFRVPYDGSNKFYDDVDVKASKEGFIAGAEWQRKKDQETIELAEDHAMLAGMNKMKEEMMENAVYGYVSLCHDYPRRRSLVAIADGLINFEYAEKVKIIIVKEEQ